ncbi:MAG: phosphoglycerate dehydrogenase [Candidatus Eremiobacteraeota bacterium]|nr:phosphoglycerate dehydrogenase [Candidatus Eremiobacteraeota bacterium]
MKVDQRTRVIVAEPFSENGLAVLRDAAIDVVDAAQSPDQLAKSLSNADGLIVRSQTRVDAAVIRAAPNLRVIGRAGVGVDSIDVDAATEAGIVVLNTPSANVIAAVEQTFALMLACFRHTADGNASVRAGRWERRAHVGRELYGKTLGIAGLGRIGAAVAERARAFGMNVLVYDPYISAAHAEAHHARLLPLDEMLQGSDIVTLHLPLNDETEKVIDGSRLQKMKPDAVLVNCARGALIDEEALLQALDRGAVSGAALDVFAEEPAAAGSTSARLQAHPRVLATPHLGGSTQEAFERVAVELARDIVNVLAGRPAEGAVNAPIPRGADAYKLRPFTDLAYRIGILCPQLNEASQLQPISITLCGEIAGASPAPIVTGFLSGLLQGTADRRISIVNADAVARERGIVVNTEHKASDEWIASLEVKAGPLRIVGTALHHGLRIVQIDEFEIDAAPEGTLIITRHQDIPGMVGRVGTILGDAGINISNMQVARAAERGQAMMVLCVDRAPIPEAMRALQKIAGMLSVRAARI